MTGKAEAVIQAECLLAVGSHPDVRLFRNHVGKGWTGQEARMPGLPPGAVLLLQARRATFGLCPGSSDAIGWRTVTVTPDMVGQRVAVFAAPEFKTLAGKPREDQQRFIAAVQRAGGFAGIARNAHDMEKLLLLP
ncbi:hypothetical protein [Roseomonas sp. USHLN139]|uniref:hypothetical protein n=1 Tax=Roseomonas sp. USHLN139 TaxID=3081298 RepID=UPI003B02C152